MDGVDTGIISFYITLSLFIIGLLLGWIFSIWQTKAKKKDMIFTLVHEKLAKTIYIPLNGWMLNLAEVLSWDNAEIDYKSYFFLFNLSKILKYRQLNKTILGDDLFYTESTASNRYLSKLMDLIILEINIILEENISGSDVSEKRLIILDFLSKLGDSANYTEFIRLVKSKSLYNNNLPNDLKTLIIDLNDMNIMKDLLVQINTCTKSISLLFSDSLDYLIMRTKLQAYCFLFYHLMNLELFKMYDSWYRDNDNILNRGNLHESIEYVLGLTESIDKNIKKYNAIIEKNNSELPENDIDQELLEQTVKDIEIKISQVSESNEQEKLLIKKELIIAELFRRAILIDLNRVNNTLDQLDMNFNEPRNSQNNSVG